MQLVSTVPFKFWIQTFFNLKVILALAALPRDKTSPQLSPDDQASKLFEHESIISQSRKEPVFRVHYALQVTFNPELQSQMYILASYWQIHC